MKILKFLGIQPTLNEVISGLRKSLFWLANEFRSRPLNFESHLHHVEKLPTSSLPLSLPFLSLKTSFFSSKISVKCPWRASTKPSLETSLCTPMYFREIIPFTRRSDLLLAKNTLLWYSEFKISLFWKFQLEISEKIVKF